MIPLISLPLVELCGLDGSNRKKAGIIQMHQALLAGKILAEHGTIWIMQMQNIQV